jgi:hypothetical protein
MTLNRATCSTYGFTKAQQGVKGGKLVRTFRLQMWHLRG